MSEKTLINFLEPDKSNTDVEKDRSLQANSDEMSNTLRQLSHQIVNVIRYHCYNKNEFHKIFQMIQNPETSRHSFIVANPYVNSRMGAFHRDDTNFVYSVSWHYLLVTKEFRNCYIPLSNDTEDFSKGSNWSVDIFQYLESCTSNPKLTKRNLESKAHQRRFIYIWILGLIWISGQLDYLDI